MGYRRKLFNDKTVIAAAAAGVVAVSAILGSALLKGGDDNDKGNNIVKLENSDSEKKDLLLKDDTKEQESKELEVAQNDDITAIKPTEKTSQNIGDDSLGGEQESINKNDDSIKNNDSKNENNNENETEKAVDANFSVTSKLIWPVEGNVIIGFDMENTVYFPTLDLYKCSDAVYIQSDIGTPVYAGHACQVEEIGYDSEIGNNVTVDMGNGYVVTYGQLRDVQIEKGATLEEGELIGYVASPTKYFTVEGSHLYIKMLKNGTVVDPLDYLNY